MDQFVTNDIAVHDSSSLDTLWRFDWRVPALLLKRWAMLLVVLFISVALGGLVVVKLLSLHSVRRWRAEVKLFHQIRSESVPSFYKQIDTKVIAEIIGNSTQVRKAGERLQLSGEQMAIQGGLIGVELDRNRPSIITVRAYYNSPEMAAALANAVAEEGLNAYIELQNGTLQGMLMERRQRRLRMQDSLYELEKSLANFSLPGSFLQPDKEMERLGEEISLLMRQLANDEAEVSRLGMICEETAKTMTGVEKEVRLLSRVMGSSDAELSHLRGRLVTMQQQYTENNPQIRIIQDEIEGRQRLFDEIARKPRGIDEEVFTINTVYTHLEERLLQAQIERVALMKRIEVEKARLGELHKVAKRQQDLSAGYQEVQRKMMSITQSITQLDGTINDMELLLNSAVPDLSILDTPAVMRAPFMNTGRSLVLSLTGAGSVVFLLIVLLVGHEVIFGTLKSPRDFYYVGNIDELGMLPESSGVSSYVLDAALHKVFIQMRMRLGDGRRIFLCQMSPNPMIDQLRASWNMNFGTNGLQVFWLKCLPLSARGTREENTERGGERIPDEGMVAIEKFGNHGCFYCENPLVLTPAEWELLNADLTELEKQYGVVVVEREMPNLSAGTLSEQFCRMVDYTVVLASFDVEKKMSLRRLLSDERLSDFPVGGVLTGVKKKYWRVFRGEKTDR
ncbi:MAG: hypothetical protein GX945_07450 [Lentisphaerae bacterium]|nr:hypothetical protein [Lentisphaerota bacterium]